MDYDTVLVWLAVTAGAAYRNSKRAKNQPKWRTWDLPNKKQSATFCRQDAMNDKSQTLHIISVKPHIHEGTKKKATPILPVNWTRFEGAVCEYKHFCQETQFILIIKQKY
jgi:hypothetical protein